MPTYEFRCDGCDKLFDNYCSIKDYTGEAKCPVCGKVSKERHYTVPDIAIKLGVDQIKTVGHLANRNRDSFSDQKKQDLFHKHNAYKFNKKGKELPSGMSRVERDLSNLIDKPRNKRRRPTGDKNGKKA